MEKLLGLPELASEHGKDVDRLIIYIHWLMIALFVGWIAYFFYVIFRFHRSRHPKADYTGVKSHASSYIEAAVALVEGVLLVCLAVPFWAKAVTLPAEKDSTVFQIVAQQFNWNVRYPGADGVFGKQEMRLVTDKNTFGIDESDPKGKDDIVTVNEMHAVVGKPVIIFISSKDVIHSFKILAMRVTQDAIPGMRIPIHFTPTKEGRYQVNCAQLCGNGHASMSQGFLLVQSQAEFDAWTRRNAGTGAAPASLE